MKIKIDYRLVIVFLTLYIVYRACYARTADPFAGSSGINQQGGADEAADYAVVADTSVPLTNEPGISVSVNTSQCGVGPQIPRSGVVEDANKRASEYLAEGTCGTGSCASDIRNPQYPVEAIPSRDPQDNIIRDQRRLIREYQSYIKNLRGSCCRRVYSNGNLLDNPLSNKNWEVRPMISDGGDAALNLQQDDFSNIMTISPDDAEKYRVSFYDQEPAPARTFALQASQNWPMYHKTFDRSFVSRIPDPPSLQPFKVNPWMDWPGDNSYCPRSGSCGGTFSSPWSTNKGFGCSANNFNKVRAPEPEIFACSRPGFAPPYDPALQTPAGKAISSTTSGDADVNVDVSVDAGADAGN